LGHFLPATGVGSVIWRHMFSSQQKVFEPEKRAKGRRTGASKNNPEILLTNERKNQDYAGPRRWIVGGESLLRDSPQPRRPG